MENVQGAKIPSQKKIIGIWGVGIFAENAMTGSSIHDSKLSAEDVTEGSRLKHLKF